jgi:hypothetical protein
MQTAHAYYDGQTIRLQEPLSLKKNDELLVTILSKHEQELTQEEYEKAILHDFDGNDYLSEEEIRYYMSLQ